MKTRTNSGLVEYVLSKLGLPYWYGTQGQDATETLYKQRRASYPSHYTASREKRYKEHIAKALQVFDCAGLIEAYIIACTGKKYDTTADMMINSCKVSGRIGTMPDMPGILVHYSGHIGVYIGGGYVVEARGFDYGVVKTKLKERPWIDWGQHPMIQYEEVATPQPKPVDDVPELPALKKGCTGDHVRVLQKLLDAGLAVDGDFGSNTHNAVLAYQRKKGLTADGIAGVKTWMALLK